MKMKKAFTLVELLVVIGIIALLISILLPALGRARQSASNVACLSNLRQMGNLVNLYTLSSKGTLPIGSWDGSPLIGTTIGAPDPTKATDWSYLLQSLLRRDGDSTSTTASRTTSLTTRKVFIDRDTVQSQNVADGLDMLHYSCHPRLMPNVNQANPDTTQAYRLRPYKLGSIRRASEIVLIMDGAQVLSNSYRSISTAYRMDSQYSYAPKSRFQSAPFLLDSDPVSNNSTSVNGQVNIDPKDFNVGTGDGSIRWRHLKNKSANFLFVDGHCESFKLINGSTSDLKRSSVNVNLFK